MASLKESIASIQSLLDAGIMSADEFEAQKEQYLADAYMEANELLAKGDKPSLLRAQSEYKEMRDYLDAASKLKLCAEKLAKLDKAEAAAQKKRKRIIAIVCTVAVVAIGVGIIAVNAAQKAEAERVAAAERAEQERIAAEERAAAERKAAEEREVIERKTNEGSKTLTSKPKVGDKVSFGLYEQDGDTSNGKEVIVWRVLAVDGNRILLISDQSLDYKRFNESKDKGNAWDSSDLKAWLTGEFADTAFTPSQKSQIAEVTCLSVEEATKYFVDDSDRRCKPTEYAKAKGAGAKGIGMPDDCFWWLRSPSAKGSEYVAIVWATGEVSTRGSNVWSDRWAVRPALWLEL